MTHVEKVEVEIMIEFTKEEKDKLKQEQDRIFSLIDFFITRGRRWLADGHGRAVPSIPNKLLFYQQSL